jgi:hypothetical protein
MLLINIFPYHRLWFRTYKLCLAQLDPQKPVALGNDGALIHIFLHLLKAGDVAKY